MYIVIDTNIFFAALLKGGKIRDLILTLPWTFLFPQTIIEEYEEHKTELLEKVNITEDGLDRLLHFFRSYVQTVPDEDLLPHLEKAKNIISLIDPDDAPFIACALVFPGSILWSDDDDLKGQNAVRVLNTQEILALAAQEN